MLRLTGKQELGGSASRKPTASQVSKYFVSNKSLFNKTQTVAKSQLTARPSSRGNLGLDFSKGFNSTMKNTSEVDNKSLDKLVLSVDKLKTAKIGSLGSTKKLSFQAPPKRVA